MRALLVFDKFKDALTARQAGEIARRALAGPHPDWTLDLCPLTDGGEGFTEVLTDALGGTLEPVKTTGPRGEAISAPVGQVPLARLSAACRARLPGLGRGDTLAIVDLASASGLALLAPDRRDPWHTTSFGTGQLLRHVADRDVAAILVGIGGSATNDLGLGALAALGVRCLGADGSPLTPPTPATWSRLTRLDGTPALPPIFIACDVTNPLLGPQGATATYGPQKGLPVSGVPRLEAGVQRMATMLCNHFGRPRSLMDAAGTGAAGGFGFGLMAACHATLLPGFDLVSDCLDLPARIAAADVILTGEGRYDATSLSGKGPGRVVAEARQAGKTVHVFAGALGVPADATTHAITPAGMPLAEALRRAPELLAQAIANRLG